MTKKLLLVLVIVLTVVLAAPAVRAEDSVDAVIPGPDCCLPFTKTVVSNSNVKVIKGNAGVPIPYNAAPHAVASWEPFLGQIDPNPSLWDDMIDYTFTGGADWIWESYRTVNPVTGDVVWFQRDFLVDGYPTAGTLHITCDNGYEVWLNGNLVGSAQLGLGWEVSDRTQPYVDGNNWQSVEAYNVSGLLKKDNNTLIVKAANEYMGPSDGEALGTIDTNPAGLIFKLDLSYSTCPPAN